MTWIKRITLSNIFFALVLVVLLYTLGISLQNYRNLAQSALAFRYPLDYGEGPMLDQTLRMLDGENLYHNDFSAPPYTISNYPPLFLLVQMPFAKAFGPAFWYGRALSILGVLLAALMIGLTLYALTGDWAASAVGGLLLLTFPYIQYWSLFNRIDSLALGLSWIAIFVVIRYHGRRWGIPAAALFFIASIYTRQSYALAAPAGAFIWLLSMRCWRKAINLALLVGGVSLGLFLMINLLTHGGFFLNIVTANVNPFSWATVKNYMGELWSNAFFLILLTGAFLISERAGKHTRSWPLVLPYVIAATLSAITVGKDGSNCNYLYELAAALCLGAGAGVAWLGRNRWIQSAVLLVLALQVGAMVGWAADNYNGRITEKTDHEQEIARLAQIVNETDGIVLTDEFMGLVPLAGKRLYYQPFEFKMLAEGGLWDQTPFLAAIVDHQFGAVLWYDPPYWDSMEARWTAQERAAIHSSYALDRVIATTLILRPRK